MASTDSLYSRLGGYDAIAAVTENLLPRLMQDPQLGRFLAHHGEDGIKREKQLLINFLCASAGGPMVYTGRDMPTTYKGDQSQFWWNEVNPLFGYSCDGFLQIMAPLLLFRTHRVVKSFL